MTYRISAEEVRHVRESTGVGLHVAKRKLMRERIQSHADALRVKGGLSDAESELLEMIESLLTLIEGDFG